MNSHLEKTAGILLAVGAALVIVSFLWMALVGGEDAYTEADAAEYLAASANLHAQYHSHDPDEVGETVVTVDSTGGVSAAVDHDEGGHDSEALAAAQARFDAARTHRDDVISQGQTTATVLRYAGVFIAVVGGIVFMVERKRSA